MKEFIGLNYTYITEDNNICKWESIKSDKDNEEYFCCGCNKKELSDFHEFVFCPYCGKKIVVMGE